MTMNKNYDNGSFGEDTFERTPSLYMFEGEHLAALREVRWGYNRDGAEVFVTEWEIQDSSHEDLSAGDVVALVERKHHKRDFAKYFSDKVKLLLSALLTSRTGQQVPVASLKDRGVMFQAAGFYDPTDGKSFDPGFAAGTIKEGPAGSPLKGTLLKIKVLHGSKTKKVVVNGVEQEQIVEFKDVSYKAP